MATKDTVAASLSPHDRRRYARFLSATGDPETAADLVQRGHVRVLRVIQRDPQITAGAGLYCQVDTWIIQDWWRSQYHSPHLLSLDAEDEHGNTLDPPDPSPSPERRLENAGLLAAIYQIARTPVQRAVLDNWDEDAEAVASQLGTTAKYIRKTRYELREKFRAHPVLQPYMRRAA